MEYFQSALTVRLRTHNNKYMVASEDGQTIKQSRNGQSTKSKWKVEISPTGGGKMIRLLSCNGKYLTATDDAFLFGVTGRKVVQSTPVTESEVAIDWEPIRIGCEIKMKARSGSKFLRANRGPPPYKDTITVDLPGNMKSKNVMWTVDILETVVVNNGGVGGGNCNARLLSCGNVAAVGSGSGEESELEMMTEDDDDDDDGDGDSVFDETASFASLSLGRQQQNGMELFHNARTVRLKSHHDKFLLANSSNDSVSQNRKNGGSRRARWTVEYVTSADGVKKLRLKSCHDKYLMATDDHYHFGMTGKKVVQRKLMRLDSSIEWEPIRDGMQIKLKTRYGNYLRANGGVPPWRNSITHDVPSRNHTKSWILWDIDVLAVYEDEKKKEKKEEEVIVEEEEEEEEDEEDDDDEPFSADWIRTTPNRVESSSSDSFATASSTSKIEGRLIRYNVVDDDGNIVDEGSGGIELIFQGKTLVELKEKLMEETGLEDVTVCSRNPLNGKLNPLLLALPPHHVKMHVFVVPSKSKVAEEL